MPRHALQRRPKPDASLQVFHRHHAGLQLAVARVQRPADVPKVRPRARALLELCKRARMGLHERNLVAEQVLRLEWKAGCLLKSVHRQRGGSKGRRGPLKETREELQISKPTGDRWERLASVGEADLDDYFRSAHATAREISTADALRWIGKAPVIKEGPFLWATWPEMFLASKYLPR